MPPSFIDCSRARSSDAVSVWACVALLVNRELVYICSFPFKLFHFPFLFKRFQNINLHVILSAPAGKNTHASSNEVSLLWFLGHGL